MLPSVNLLLVWRQLIVVSSLVWMGIINTLFLTNLYYTPPSKYSAVHSFIYSFLFGSIPSSVFFFPECQALRLPAVLHTCFSSLNPSIFHAASLFPVCPRYVLTVLLHCSLPAANHLHLLNSKRPFKAAICKIQPIFF